MKATINLVSFFFLFLLIACGPKGKKVDATAAKTPATTPASSSASAYTLNNGTLNWTGSKLVGTSSHNGTVNISQGEIQVANNQVTSGQFTIDMTSVTNLDQEAGQGKEKLEGHLKSADFFDVAQFPTAAFVLTGATPVSGQADVTHNVTGNLTIKGITKSITFPANIAIIGNNLTAVSPAFVIDRTQWGIEYGSGSIADLAKDKVINDDIALVLNLAATSSGPVQ